MPEIVSGFNMQAPVHIDNRCIKDTVAERDDIPEGVRYEYMKVTCKDTGITYQLIGGITNDCWKAIEASTAGTGMRIGGCTWFIDTDKVINAKGEDCGTLSQCMTGDFAGTWFYAVTSTSEAGSAAYPTQYTIDGANGYLSLRDYVVWTGGRLVHIPTFEAKASDIINSDGQYSPRGGVDGLMSSTDKAYLSDLINSFWGKRYIPVYNTPTEVAADWTSGYLVNWCRDTGWYLGGFAENCGGHPPVVNNNHTSWILLVLVGTVKAGVFPHALQVAFDLSNGLIYMRKGWLDGNSAVSGWADVWTQVGDIADGAITTAKIAECAVTEEKLSKEFLESLDKALKCSGIAFAKDADCTVQLSENTRELVVCTEGANVNIIIPADDWIGWRCVINLAGIKTVGVIDVGFANNMMFGSDALWSTLEAGKVYVLEKISDDYSPLGYRMNEIDADTRLPLDVARKEDIPDVTGKEDKSNKGKPNGYTPLNEEAVVPDEHLPITREHTLLSNALKGSASGAIIAFDDVSPVEHEVECVVKSKNLLKYPYYQTTKTQNGITFTDNGDGSITVNGTATANTTFIFGGSTVAKSPRKLPKGVWVTASSNSPNVQFAIQAIKDDGSLKGVAYLYNDSKKFFTDYENYYVYLYVLEGKEVNSETVYPQLEEGTESTEWVPYVAPESVALSKYGKNIALEDNMLGSKTTAWGFVRQRITLPAGKYVVSTKFKQTGYVGKVGLAAKDTSGNFLDSSVLSTGTTETGALSCSFELTERKVVSLQFYVNATTAELETEAVCEFTNIQLEVDNGTGLPTAFEAITKTDYTPNADGTVDGVTSLAPNMTLMTDTENTYADVTYNRDINKAFEEMYNAIISLGGNI